MPDDMSQETAEAILRADGRYVWLLDGPKMWSVKDLATAFSEHIGVSRSADTALAWVKRLPESGRENYGGSTGWRAKRDALVVFFAQGEHLHKGVEDGRDQVG